MGICGPVASGDANVRLGAGGVLDQRLEGDTTTDELLVVGSLFQGAGALPDRPVTRTALVAENSPQRYLRAAWRSLGRLDRLGGLVRLCGHQRHDRDTLRGERDRSCSSCGLSRRLHVFGPGDFHAVPSYVGVWSSEVCVPESRVAWAHGIDELHISECNGGSIVFWLRVSVDARCAFCVFASDRVGYFDGTVGV